MPEIASPLRRRLYEYWDEKRAGRAMPARADIDPVEMAFALGNIILADVLDEVPPRFRIRLHGTTLVQYAGYDLTGKMLDDMPLPEFRERARQSFSKVARDGEPLHLAADRVIDERMRRYETMLMPLSSDGTRVDMLLIGMVYADERR
jgi:hypothetical protein